MVEVPPLVGTGWVDARWVGPDPDPGPSPGPDTSDGSAGGEVTTVTAGTVMKSRMKSSTLASRSPPLVEATIAAPPPPDRRYGEIRYQGRGEVWCSSS